MSTLASRCRPSFDRPVLNLGEQQFRRDDVIIRTVEGDLLLALVSSISGRQETVQVDWSEVADGLLYVDCTCSGFLGASPCQHVWATILEMDMAGYKIPAIGQLDIVGFDDEDDWYDEPDDPFDEFLDGPPIVGFPQVGHRAESSAPDWMVQVRDVMSNSPPHPTGSSWDAENSKKRETWYVLDTSECIARSSLVISLYKRETKKNGEWGKFTRAAIDSAQVDHLQDEQDRPICRFLSRLPTPDEYYNSYRNYGAYDYHRASSFSIPSDLIELILPQIAATGRLVWQLNSSLPISEAMPLTWDAEPWQLRLEMQANEERQCWTLDGCFACGEETKKLGDAVCCFENGLTVFPDRLARFHGSQAPWIEALRSSPIEVPFSDRDPWLNWLCSLPQIPEIALPPELKPAEEKLIPTGRLAVVGPLDYQPRHLMFGNVGFDYGEQTISLKNEQRAQFDPEQNRILVRDGDTERQLLAQLNEQDIQPAGGYFGGEVDVQFSEKQFFQIVKNLTEKGWIIEAKDGLRIRRPGAVRMSVTTDVDWFELEGEVDFGGVSASLPRLLAAVRDGDEFVVLDDGSKGILPEEWLKRYSGLARLGEESDGSLRFASCQALLLDAMLAEQDNVDVDRQFDQMRKKLKSFEGVDKRQEPRGFQGELREYQREGLGWLNFLQEFRFGGCLADDMGLGKTVQVLALLQSRRQRRVPSGSRRAPSIVVVPKSLVFNWIDEATRFAPKLRVRNYTGLDRKGQLEELDQCDLLVTTYGTLRRDVAELKEIVFDYAILDESQAIKNHNSQAAKACRLLKAEHRLAMTGTPVENHLGELWSLFEFLNPGMLGRSTAFAALSKTKPGEENGSLPLLANALRPFLLRRTKDQVLTELPEKTEQTLYCEMSKKQRKEYDELRDYYRLMLSKKVEEQGLKKSKIHVLEALLRLRQAACHPGLIDKQKADEPSAKLEALLEQLEEVLHEGHKALVFSQFTSLLSIVRGHLDKKKLPYAYLDGRTRKRGDKVKQFQEDPKCQLFLISLKAGGHGLNLTAADYVFILDPWWNPAVEAQAVDRAHRIGQTRRVFAYRLICRDTVEDKILELQKSKRDLADAIVSADNSLIRSLTTEDLQLLLT